MESYNKGIFCGIVLTMIILIAFAIRVINEPFSEIGCFAKEKTHIRVKICIEREKREAKQCLEEARAWCLIDLADSKAKE